MNHAQIIKSETFDFHESGPSISQKTNRVHCMLS